MTNISPVDYILERKWYSLLFWISGFMMAMVVFGADAYGEDTFDCDALETTWMYAIVFLIPYFIFLLAYDG